MADINILKSKCVGCKRCISTCPFGAIEMSDKKAVITEKCTLCGACVESCKFSAIEFKRDVAEYSDIKGYRGVWVFAEQRYGRLKAVTLELLNQAKKIASDLNDSVTAVLLGDNVMGLSKELSAFGADRVLVVDQPWLRDFDDRVYGEIILDLIKEYKPEILLMGATSNGRSAAPYISSLLKTGLTADCISLEVNKEDRLLMQTRPAFGGNLMATIVCPGRRPQMATVRPKVFKPCKPDYDRKGEVILIPSLRQVEPNVRKIKVMDNTDSLNLSDADIIIGVGKGIGNSKNIEQVKMLADALGSAIGATRAVVDAGWMPYSQQIGQTGKTVAPKLYIALGISGAIQHLAGLSEIETVIAVNSDPDAPVFKVAHYGIVGDCMEIIPLLAEKLKRSL